MTGERRDEGGTTGTTGTPGPRGRLGRGTSAELGWGIQPSWRHPLYFLPSRISKINPPLTTPCLAPAATRQARSPCLWQVGGPPWQANRRFPPAPKRELVAPPLPCPGPIFPFRSASRDGPQALRIRPRHGSGGFIALGTAKRGHRKISTHE